MHTLISIIIPTFNSAASIERCLKSVVLQNHYDFEVIIVDNGSTDNTLDLIKSYQNKLPALQTYSCPNGKQGSARNIGILHSSGNYIAFIDSDDYIHPNYLSYLCSISNESDVVITPFEFKFNNNHGQLIAPNSIASSKTKPALIQNVSVFSKLFKKSFLDEFQIRFEQNILYEDFPFWADVLKNARTIEIGDQPHYYYVQHDNQCTKKPVYDDFKTAYRISIQKYPKVETYNNFNILIIEHLVYFIIRECRRDRLKIFEEVSNDILNQFNIPESTNPSFFFNLGYRLIIKKQYVLFFSLIVIPYKLYHSAPQALIQLARKIIFITKRRSFRN